MPTLLIADDHAALRSFVRAPLSAKGSAVIGEAEGRGRRLAVAPYGRRMADSSELGFLPRHEPSGTAVAATAGGA